MSGDVGWGTDLGSPVSVLDPDGPTVDVVALEAVALHDHRPPHDELDGPGHGRRNTTAGAVDRPVDVASDVRADP